MRFGVGDAKPQAAEAAGLVALSPDQVTETAELRGRLEEAMAGLPEVQREIVLLHDLEGWKHREIADRLELPSGTVRSHLHFARKALRDALRNVPDEPPAKRNAR